MKFQFLRQNAKWLIAPLLLALGSGFGQTFFIAIFGGALRTEFGLSNGAWGTIYLIGTLASAIVMVALGSAVDHIPLRRIVVWVITGLIGFLLLMALNRWVIALPILIFGLRFFGQGMMMHISQVATARWFRANRAKAMAYAIGGIAIAEALFPLAFVRIMERMGWRMSFVIAALLVLALGFILYARLEESRIPQGQAQNEDTPGMFAKSWTRKEALTSWVFWLALPATATMAFLTTIFFFQIPVLVQEKGWGLAEFTARLPIFTLCAFTTLIFAGGWIDRIGSRRFMGWAFIPMMFGYFFIYQAQSLSELTLALFVMGLGQGAAAAFLNVWIVDFFGTKHLGAIRAFYMGMIVLSTGAGPMLSGILLDWGISFNTQLLMMSLYAALACAILTFIAWRTKSAFATPSHS